MQFNHLTFPIFLNLVRSLKIAHEKNLFCSEFILLMNHETKVAQTYTEVPNLIRNLPIVRKDKSTK